jgi:AraC-like DNA-binding protein/mannose-6-phosphate isomerase-like protein (cupin superfamily)
MFRPGQTAGRPVRGHPLDFAAGSDTGWHRHPRGQLVHALSGTLTCATVDGTWVVPPDRAVWVPPGRRHRLAAHGPVAARMLYLRPDAWDGGDRCRVLAVGPLLRALVLACCAPAPRGRAAQAAEARRTAVLLDELAAAPEAGLHLAPGQDPRLRRLTAALLADPADGRDLAAWGRAVGASQRTLARLFPAETGLTFAAWRWRARLLRALALLAEGRPVTQVALDLGYAGPSAFIQAFRRELGTTPGQFARRRG